MVAYLIGLVLNFCRTGALANLPSPMVINGIWDTYVVQLLQQVRAFLQDPVQAVHLLRSSSKAAPFLDSDELVVVGQLLLSLVSE